MWAACQACSLHPVAESVITLALVSCHRRCCWRCKSGHVCAGRDAHYFALHGDPVQGPEHLVQHLRSAPGAAPAVHGALYRGDVPRLPADARALH